MIGTQKQMSDNLINEYIYVFGTRAWDKSNFHPVFRWIRFHPVLKKLKAYLREIYVYTWQVKTEHKKKSGFVVGASMWLIGVALNKDFENWMVLKGKWSNKDNAWKYSEL